MIANIVISFVKTYIDNLTTVESCKNLKRVSIRHIYKSIRLSSFLPDSPNNNLNNINLIQYRKTDISVDYTHVLASVLRV